MKGNCCRDSFFATSTPARMAIVQPFEITGFDRRVRSHRLSKCRLCSAKVLMPCLCILVSATHTY